MVIPKTDKGMFWLRLMIYRKGDVFNLNFNCRRAQRKVVKVNFKQGMAGR